MQPNFNDRARAHLKTIAAAHVAKNARSYKFRTYDATPTYNMLGGRNYLSPSSGKVVDVTADMVVIKTGRAEFDVIDAACLRSPVEVGEQVDLSYYQLRRFDGSLADGSEDECVGGSRTISLTGAKAFFPVTFEGRYFGTNEDARSVSYQKIQSTYLIEMVKQFEHLRSADGRSIVSVLVDAGGKNLEFVDPIEDDDLRDPSISMNLHTIKFGGRLEIGYALGADTYYLVLRTQGREDRFDDIHFDEVAALLVDKIDDGSWRYVRMAKKSKARAPSKIELPLAA